MSKEYRNQEDKTNLERVKKILSKLPFFLDDYFRSMKISSFSSNTMLEYAYDLKDFFDFLSSILDKEPRDITLSDIENVQRQEIEIFISANTQSGLTPSDNRRSRKLSSLRGFYKYYSKDGTISKNPAALVETPKIHKKEVSFLENEEIARLMHTVETGEGLSDREKVYAKKTYYRDKAIFSTLLGTGIRVSELVGLNTTDYDSQKMCFHLLLKGGNEDISHFGDNVNSAVANYLEYERCLRKPNEKNKNALFLSLQGTRITVRAVEKLVKKYALASGLPEYMAPHILRHTYGTQLYQMTGGDVYMVKDALHHASLETGKRYIGNERERKRKAGEISDQLFQ